MNLKQNKEKFTPRVITKKNKEKFTPRVITKKSQKKKQIKKGALRIMQKRQLYENKMENRRQWSDMFNELRKCNCQLVF